MEFVLWASKAVHVTATVVWLGGLIYYNAVLAPVLKYEGRTRDAWLRAVEGRAQGVIWSVASPLIVTGIILLVFQPKLSSISWDDIWTWLIATKILFVTLMVFFGWQSGVVIRTMRDVPAGDAEQSDAWYRSLERLVKRSIVCGLGAVLAAVSLSFV